MITFLNAGNEGVDVSLVKNERLNNYTLVIKDNFDNETLVWLSENEFQKLKEDVNGV